jgi:hypothetical protein
MGRIVKEEDLLQEISELLMYKCEDLYLYTGQKSITFDISRISSSWT